MTTSEIVKRAYGYFLEGNIPALMDTYSDEVEYHIMGGPEVPYAGSFVGKQQVMGFFQKLGETLDFTQFDVREMVCEGDQACVLLDLGATVKATGKHFSSPTVHWIVVKGGLIKSFSDFAETHKIHAALK